MFEREVLGKPTEAPQPYKPPEGIDGTLFEQLPIPRMAFLLKSENAAVLDPTTLHLLSGEIYAMATKVDWPADAQVIFTPEQMEGYTERYIDMILGLLEEVVAAGGSVAVTGSPVGGLAPLHAVMEGFSQQRGEDKNNRVEFFPYLKQPAAFEALKKAELCLLIDDGLARFSTQIELLYAYMPEEDVQALLRRLHHEIAQAGNCNNSDLIPLFTDIMQLMADHNIVVAPSFNKNIFFAQVSQAVIDANINNRPAWAAAQQRVIDFPIQLVDVDKTSPGGAMRGAPCRDIGVTLGELKAHIPHEVYQQISNAGVENNATIRLLANYKGVVSLTDEQVQDIIIQFAQHLKNRFL